MCLKSASTHRPSPVEHALVCALDPAHDGVQSLEMFRVERETMVDGESTLEGEWGVMGATVRA